MVGSLDASVVLQSTVDGSFADLELLPPAVEVEVGVAVRKVPAKQAGIMVDGVALAAAAAVAATAQAFVHSHRAGISVESAYVATIVRLVLSLPLLTLVLARSRHRSRSRIRVTFTQELHEVALPLAAGGLACLAGWRVLFLATHIAQPSLDAVLLTCCFGLTTVAVARTAYFCPPTSRGKRKRRVVILGSGLVAHRLAEQLTDSGGVEIVGFLDDDPQVPSAWLGPLRDLVAVCERDEVQHVVVAFSRSGPEDMVEVLRPIQGKLPITVLPRLFDVVPTTADVHELASGFPGISVAPGGRGRTTRIAKRALDMCAAGFGLVVLSPALLVIAVAIRLTSSGPVLLRQTRIGADGEEFPMFKFRTMVVQATHPSAQGSDAVMGPFPKLKCDPRVTAIGAVLRRRSLDELPQLLNVLNGTMSLVGPRPFVPQDAASIEGWARKRYTMPPGITGLWQVSGRNDLTFDEMCRLDHLYVSCWSIGLDIRILLRTLRVVALGRGAY